MNGTTLYYVYIAILLIVTLLIIIYSYFNYQRVHSRSHNLVISAVLFINLKFYFEIPFLFGSENLTSDLIFTLYQVGSISYIFTHIAFGLILLRTGIKGLTSNFANIGLITAFMSLGMVIINIFNPNTLYHFISIDSGWRVDIDLIALVTISISTFCVLMAFVTLFRVHTSLPVHFEERNSNLLFYLTIGSPIIGSIMRYWIELSLPGINNGNYQLINVISNLIMSLGALFLSLFLFLEPLFSIYIHKNSKDMIKRGIIGWVITSMTEVGPQIRIKSDIFVETNSIAQSSLFSFTSMSLVLSSGNDFFQNKVFSLPFNSGGDYLGICISFTHKDDNLKDPRADHQSFSIFVVFIPDFMVPLLSNPIGRMDELMKIVNKKIQTTADIDEFCEKEFVEDLTAMLLDKIH